MDAQIYSEKVVRLFDQNLLDEVYHFIEGNEEMHELYKRSEERYGKRVVRNVLNDFLVEALQKHRPIVFTDDLEFRTIEEFLEQLGYSFVSSLMDVIFQFIERKPVLLDEISEFSNELPFIQKTIQALLEKKYSLVATDKLITMPVSKLLESYVKLDSN